MLVSDGCAFPLVGSRARLELALTRGWPCAAQTSGSDECQLGREPATPPVLSVHTVYVGNLAPTVNERHLWDAFGVCGRIRSLQVARSRSLGQSSTSNS